MSSPLSCSPSDVAGVVCFHFFKSGLFFVLAAKSPLNHSLPWRCGDLSRWRLIQSASSWFFPSSSRQRACVMSFKSSLLFLPVTNPANFPDTACLFRIPCHLCTSACERASCYARANLPRTIPKSYLSWLVAICEESVPTCTVVSSNTSGVHVPRRLYACLAKTEVPD